MTLAQALSSTLQTMSGLAKEINENLEPEFFDGSYNDNPLGLAKDMKDLENHTQDAAALFDDLRVALGIHVERSKELVV
jgi:hypothetical protein